MSMKEMADQLNGLAEALRGNPAKVADSLAMAQHFDLAAADLRRLTKQYVDEHNSQVQRRYEQQQELLTRLSAEVPVYPASWFGL